VVRPDVVASKVARARTWLKDATQFLDAPVEDFRSDPQGRDLALFYVFLAIQECIDLAAHWVADEGWGEPDDAGSSFDVIAERGGISHEVATALRGASGLRNRIAHGYAQLDYERVHREARVGIPAIRQFLAAIAAAAGL
jgi:uncharacterized protein YutE (UPF0331/DUF86 family)